ncbi:putative phosphoenolpyruvate synthase, partial [Stegodyphus mimosarum]
MGTVITAPITYVSGLVSAALLKFLFWSKWVFSRIYIETKKKSTPKRVGVYDKKAFSDPEKIGFIVPENEFHLESPCPESHLKSGEDEVFCYGVNSKSEYLSVSISRRSDQKADACIYLKLASGKTYHLQKTDHFQKSCSDKNVFSCGDLQMSYTCPMRRWRIFYSGYLRETNGDDSEMERIVYVKSVFWWKAASNIFDSTLDINSKSLAGGLSKVNWKSSYPQLEKLKCALNFYVQSGTLHGTVAVDGEQDEQEIYLFGQRIRNLGETSFLENSELDHMLGYVHQNGAYIYLTKASLSNVVKDLCFGCVVQPDCALKSAKKTEIIITESEDVTFVKSTFQNECSYKLSGSFSSPVLQIYNKRDGVATSFSLFGFNVNEKKGTGVHIKRHITEISKKEIPEVTIEKSSLTALPLVVFFTDELCQDPELTGGKGSSLGRLTHLSRDLQTFIVPKGIVVTTTAYQHFVTEEILAKIKVLEDVLYGNTEGDVKAMCESLCEEFEKTEFSEETNEAIEMCLKGMFENNLDCLKFAVRSSATGEDTEQMSAAGQMDTFLGISGISEILHSVKKCWASQFGTTAIHYKRRYGQCLNSPMAVVIQEMIACDVAGVLFTCDPLTGNPTIMTITANYGLGESVVSGTEEPDTIELQRDPEDHLRVKNTVIGAKSRKIIVKEGEGTVLENVSENEKTSCCLSEDMIMRLGQLGIEVEKYCRSHRDIEWGFWNNNLYLFQSRPVTSGMNETIFEIDHEFDCPLRVEKDFSSTCNIGEVMPGAITPFGLEYMAKMFSIAMHAEKTAWVPPVYSRYFFLGWMMAYNHAMFLVTDMFRGQKPGDLHYFAQATMLAFFGRIIDDEEIFQICEDRYGDTKPEFSLLSLLRVLWINQKRLQKEQKAYAKYRIQVEKFKTSKELFDHLLQNCCSVLNAYSPNMLTSQASMVWNLFVFTILGKARRGFSNEVYSDLAYLLKTSCDVESADVPSAMQSLAFQISEAINVDEFKHMSVEEALHWLQNTPSAAGKKFREFLEKHGHRCLKEFDVYSIPWASDPKPLVKLLQNMAGNVSKDFTKAGSKNFNEILSNLSLSLGFFSRSMLKFLLPLSHRAVRNRE